MNGRRAHRTGTFVLSLLMAIIGVGLIAQAVTGSAGTVSHLLLGMLFIAAGGGRSYVELRRGRDA
jgi:hypothetical protein